MIKKVFYLVLFVFFLVSFTQAQIPSNCIGSETHTDNKDEIYEEDGIWWDNPEADNRAVDTKEVTVAKKQYTMVVNYPLDDKGTRQKGTVLGIKTKVERDNEKHLTRYYYKPIICDKYQKEAQSQVD